MASLYSLDRETLIEIADLLHIWRTSEGIDESITVEDFLKPLMESIAEIETNPATRNHSIGDIFFVDGYLYKASKGISSGDEIVEGTNVVKTDIARSGGSGGGHRMIPDTSIITNPTEKDIVEGIEELENTDQHVVSGWATKTWSNICLERRIVIENDPSSYDRAITSWGIGEWRNSVAGITEADEISWGWYHDEALELDDKLREWGCNADNIDLSFKFDPLSVKFPVALGGYILDTATGYLCIKFAKRLTNSDVKKVRIAIDVKVTRTNVG